MQIAGRKIGVDQPPYIIAEMSANHNGKIENALNIISAAHKAGADAVKLQTYTAETITLNLDTPEFMIQDGLWCGQSLYSLYESAHTPWEWHKPLFDHARKCGIAIFSSPFDNTAIDFLEDLNVPAYKIASFEAVDLSLIAYAASTGKPLIISTGMADGEEISEAIDAARSAGCKDLAILHCVSGYPAPAENYNLRTIPDMISRYGTLTGLSDHTLSNTTAIASVALGACIIEKHFTLNRDGGGPDDSFSMEEADLVHLIAATREAHATLGSVDYGLKSSELGNIKFRRSLYFVKDLKAGATISPACVRSVRPGYGLAPKFLVDVVGAVVTQDVAFGSPVTHGSFRPRAV